MTVAQFAHGTRDPPPKPAPAWAEGWRFTRLVVGITSIVRGLGRLGTQEMFFNDDSMLDFRANGMSDGIFGGFRGGPADEMTFIGRVPGALYAQGLTNSETFETSAQLPEELLAAIAAQVAANDDDAPALLLAPSHGKDAEPLVLPQALIGGDDAEALVQPDLSDLFDLAIPPLPAEVDLSMITVTPPNSVEAEPVVFGGPAYQSLSFLILDTPFVVGDDQLPASVRPSIEELLGLAGDDTWVLPSSDTGAWLLG